MTLVSGAVSCGVPEDQSWRSARGVGARRSEQVQRPPRCERPMRTGAWRG
jgi:hypothetical protein